MGAQIVVGLGFGDEGKGITTDYLCSQASDAIVIRFSGGQQCGHTVVLNGRKHIHSSFGSGTLRGVPSYFGEHTTIYPLTLYNEEMELRRKGIKPSLTIHPLAALTTPYDVAVNRISERKKGHGSCGLGIAATMKRNIESPYKLYAVDLLHPEILKQKMKNLKSWYLDRYLPYGDDRKAFLEECRLWEDDYFRAIEKTTFNIQNYSYLLNYGDWIFEGSQGIMLDASHGIFPNVTYANTTSRNAVELCKYYNRGYEIYYVTRCYQTRHGAGWMSNEGGIKLVNNEEEINVHNEWQKDFRVGEIDYKLLNQALKVDSIYSDKMPHTVNLVVTCLDQRPDFKLELDKFDIGFNKVLNCYSPHTEGMKVQTTTPVYARA